MSQKTANDFTVESIRPEQHGPTITLQTVVLAPARGNKIFGKNSVARIELVRLDPEMAETFTVGEGVEVEITNGKPATE